MPPRKKRRSSSGSGLGWFIGGIIIGLGGAVLLYTRGFMPTASTPEPAPAAVDERSEPGLLDDERERASGYDFFTVLPEMEVVVPERELQPAPPSAPEGPAASGGEDDVYVLQAGSFRNSADADQMKAQLALLGAMANIQTVTVDGQTWHRVRVGPVRGTREVNQLRNQLRENGIDTLVLKGSG
jgi:cell division protein FtsN